VPTASRSASANSGSSSPREQDLVDQPGLQLSECLDRPGGVVFEHACKLGLEGIVSKRRGSRYESGRLSHWLKIKNPNHPAVLRLLEEDWNG
jgi:hypothetical protein